MDRIAGHYLIEEKLGEGSFAVVYKGRDVRLNRKVAIKVLRENHSGDVSAWARLLAEGQASSALNHPNICRLYDIGEEQETAYVVYELIEGQTLKSILKSGPLPYRIALWDASQIAAALAHAHSAGILHRDLTSSNMMVTPSGVIKVIDFGLARSISEGDVSEAKKSHSSMEEAGWIGGTLPYLAPEVLHGEGTTVQSDLWSHGVILYEMLTGRLPFTGRTLFEVSVAIMIGDIVPLPNEIPSSLRAIVYRCLAKNKGVRYKSAHAVQRHLDAELEIIAPRALPRIIGGLATKLRRTSLF